MDYMIHRVRHSKVISEELYRVFEKVCEWQVEHGQNEASKLKGVYEEFTNLKANYLDKGAFFVAQDGRGKLVGLVGVRVDSTITCSLKRLAVLPDYHGKGLGTRLVLESISWARDNGYKTIKLSTGENETGKPLYERFGFKEYARDDKNRDHLMSLELA